MSEIATTSGRVIVRRMAPVVALAALLLPSTARAQAPAAGPAADTTAPRVRSSWTSDRREYRAGDILTVIVDERTLASANKGQSGTDETTRDNGLGVGYSMAAGGTSVDVKVGTDKRSTSRQTGQASRDVRFRGEMTVRVVKVDAAGVLEVKGSRTVDVDKNKQQLTLTGFVRAEDVSRANVVESARIADAQLVYVMQGDLGKTRGGIIGRLISAFWP